MGQGLPARGPDLLESRVFWDLQQLNPLLLRLKDEGLFDVLCAAEVLGNRNHLERDVAVVWIRCCQSR